ncbi:hypothetical protein R3P38DRAFT_2856033 [Favolaschia claudopus]|uniref:F-box domain-containing protein n=1 Tax=Favolaschia claudopus TaxID=2862362 RepID=A0AAW0DR37_9AGAR
MESSQTKLLDLPNELLLLIFRHPDIPFGTLLFLSMLCRRLNYLALSIFLETCGMQEPTQKVNATMFWNRIDGVSALRLALFIPSIDTLSCSLPSCETFDCLFLHIRRLRLLIERLEFVRTVTLDLKTPDVVWDLDETVPRSWALEFGDLLNMIVKRGCTSLTIRHGHFFHELYQLRPISFVSRPVNALRNAVRHILPKVVHTASSDIWQFWQPFAHIGKDLMELDLEGRSMSRLAHLRIGSATLLIPPSLGWTLSALRHSPITAFEICGVTLMHEDWATVLPLLAAAIPNLTSLTLSNLCGVSGADILLFLAKLQHLKICTVRHTEYNSLVQSAYPDSAPTATLPSLTRLHAPSTLILHLLRKRPSLPNLTHLCMTPHRLIMTRSDLSTMRHIGHSLSQVVARLKKCKLSPELSLEVDCARQEMPMGVAQTYPLGEEMIKPFRAITRLIISGTRADFPDSGAELEVLERWIAWCPALVHVSISRVSDDIQKDDNDWATLERARTITERHPTVQSLELNGKVFDNFHTRRKREYPFHINMP